MSGEAPQRTRMPATERRASILAAATDCFAERGYSGTSTASIATRASVNEALLFRHFGTKRDLYKACIDSAWLRIRERADELFTDEPEARHWRMPGRAFLELVRAEPDVARLWMRGLVETTGDADIDEHIGAHMRDVHEYVTKLIERSAAAGALLPGRDPSTEAWTVVALGLLGASLGTRGLVEEPAFDAVLASHREWMTGDPE